MTFDYSSEFYHIGKIHQPHGLTGHVIASFTDKRINSLIKKGAFCFIELKHQTYVPYKIAYLSKTHDDAIIGFDTFHSIEAAKELSGKKLFFHNEQVPRSYLSENKNLWIGYTIYDNNSDFWSVIDDIVTLPGQELAQLTHNGKGIMIPMSEALITDIDHNKKAIRMDIPDGLLEI